MVTTYGMVKTRLFTGQQSLTKKGRRKEKIAPNKTEKIRKKQSQNTKENSLTHKK